MSNSTSKQEAHLTMYHYTLVDYLMEISIHIVSISPVTFYHVVSSDHLGIKIHIKYINLYKRPSNYNSRKIWVQ